MSDGFARPSVQYYTVDWTAVYFGYWLWLNCNQNISEIFPNISLTGALKYQRLIIMKSNRRNWIRSQTGFQIPGLHTYSLDLNFRSYRLTLEIVPGPEFLLQILSIFLLFWQVISFLNCHNTEDLLHVIFLISGMTFPIWLSPKY